MHDKKIKKAKKNHKTKSDNWDGVFFVYVPFPANKETKKAIFYIVKKHLAGCVNIFPVESIYYWKGKIVEGKEVVVIFKTTKTKLDKLIKEIKNHHPYEIPCIAPMEISKINKEFLNWLNKEVKK